MPVMNVPEILRANTIQICNYIWINIDNPNAELLNYLLDVHQFHHLDLEDCISKIQLPKIDEYPDYLFIILHSPKYLKEKRFSIPAQIGIFLGKDFIITVHSGDLKPINRIFQKCSEDVEIHKKEIGFSPTFLLYKIIYDLIDNIMLMLRKVIEEIEKIEDKVFNETLDAVRELTELRHNVANIRRVVFSMRNVIHELEKKIKKFSDNDLEVYFSDLSDYINKAWVILDECKETIEIFKDTDFIISSDRTNRILTILTILFTFSIPITILSSLYGMNIVLPGDINAPWTFWGPYTTLIILMIVVCFSILFMYWIFHRAKWL